MHYQIEPDKCSGCGLCIDVCAQQAISPYGIYQIDQNICLVCGICQDNCPCNAITLHQQGDTPSSGLRKQT